MSEIHYVERVPRRRDFCGCPPCHLCYEPVITDDQQAPTFQEVMKEIYQEGPAPQTEQEYEWAHAAAHETRKELEALQSGGTYFEDEDRARMTAMQVDDLLKRAKKSAEAPKPLNRVNLDDMPAEAVQALERQAAKRKKQPADALEYYDEAMKKYAAAKEAYLRGKLTTSVQVPLSTNLTNYGVPAYAFSSAPGGSGGSGQGP